MKRGPCPCLRSRVIEFLIRSAQSQFLFRKSCWNYRQSSSIPHYHSLRNAFTQLSPDLKIARLQKTGFSIQLKKVICSYLLLSLYGSQAKYMILLPYLLKPSNHLVVNSSRSNIIRNLQELVLMQVLGFEIGTSNIVFVLVEDLLSRLKVVARVGEHVKFEACMDIMDLLYEIEETSVLYSSPQALAASILVVAYVITVPAQSWEFPVLPWVKFVTSCKEEDVLDYVRVILKHVLEPQPANKGSNG